MGKFSIIRNRKKYYASYREINDGEIQLTIFFGDLEVTDILLSENMLTYLVERLDSIEVLEGLSKL